MDDHPLAGGGDDSLESEVHDPATLLENTSSYDADAAFLDAPGEGVNALTGGGDGDGSGGGGSNPFDDPLQHPPREHLGESASPSSAPTAAPRYRAEDRTFSSSSTSSRLSVADAISEGLVPADEVGAGGSTSSSSSAVAAAAGERVRQMGHAGSTASPVVSSTGRRGIEVTVTNPEKVGEGINAYVSYRVNSTVDLSIFPQFDHRENSVRRRFRDFEWLHTVLKAEHRGSIIPPLPSKFLTNRFTSAFLEQRRRALFKFLYRIANHPKLSHTRDFQVFLEAPEDALQNFKVGKNPSLGVGESVLGMFRSLGRTITSSVQNTTEPLTPNPRYEAVKSYAEGLESHLRQLAKAIDGVGRRRQELAAATEELGTALTMLGVVESDNSPLGTALTRMGRATEQLAVLDKKQADKEAAFFSDPVREYIGMTQAVQDMLKHGDDSHLAYHAACVESDAAEARQAPLRDRDALAAARDRARDDHRAILRSIQDEIIRFRKEKTGDFRRVLHNFVNLEINHANRVLYGWEGMVPLAEAIEEPEAAVQSNIPQEEDSS